MQCWLVWKYLGKKWTAVPWFWNFKSCHYPKTVEKNRQHFSPFLEVSKQLVKKNGFLEPHNGAAASLLSSNVGCRASDHGTWNWCLTKVSFGVSGETPALLLLLVWAPLGLMVKPLFSEPAFLTENTTSKRNVQLISKALWNTYSNIFLTLILMIRLMFNREFMHKKRHRLTSKTNTGVEMIL